MKLLEVSAVTKNFGGVIALNNVSLTIEEGAFYGIIGPNGSGKTTLFNLLTGLFPVNKGSIKFRGNEITKIAPHQITRFGIARTFQLIRLFGSMSVLENLMVGSQSHYYLPLAPLLFSKGKRMSTEKRIMSKAEEVLSAIGLEEKKDWPAKTLSYGEQRRLEIGRALATNPSLLLLDEPMAGMNGVEAEELGVLLRGIANYSTVILIEHNVRMVMGLCDRIAVFNFGKKIAEGTPEAIRRNPQVIEAYLGGEEELA